MTCEKNDNEPIVEEAAKSTERYQKPEQLKEYGTQPLDAIMDELGLKNTALVQVSCDGLTHKQIRKGRAGRRLTRNIQDKITASLNECAEKEYQPTELFTYR